MTHHFLVVHPTDCLHAVARDDQTQIPSEGLAFRFSNSGIDSAVCRIQSAVEASIFNNREFLGRLYRPISSFRELLCG